MCKCPYKKEQEKRNCSRPYEDTGRRKLPTNQRVDRVFTDIRSAVP